MNETNIKHGYSLMVCDARHQGRYFEFRGIFLNPGCANFKSKGKIYATRAGRNIDQVK